METTLRESLINYYIQLLTTDEKWKEFSKIVERPLQALKNQSEQFRLVIRNLAYGRAITSVFDRSNEVDSAEICRMEGVRDKLIFKINVGIENEVSLILGELRRVKNHVEDLKMRLQRLEIARGHAIVHEPSFKELVDGTPHIPRLDRLMEWAIESSRYYNELWATIYQNFNALDYKSEKKMNSWIKSFAEKRQRRTTIERILGFTRFLVMEHIK